MMQEGMRAGVAVAERRMEQIKIKISERSQQLIEADEEKNGAIQEITEAERQADLL